MPQQPTVLSQSYASQLLLWGMRHWVRVATGEASESRLTQAYQAAGCTNALGFLDELMGLLTVGARDTVEIREPAAPRLSADELTLVRALRALQRGRCQPAEQAVGRLIRRPLERTFCRTGALYVQALHDAGHQFGPEVELRLVH